MSRWSNGAPLSTSATSWRHCSRVAAGNSAARGRSSAGGSGMVTKCHAAGGGPTASRLLGLHARGRRSWWRQLLDAACVYLRQCIAHTPAGDHPLRRDLRERRQYEGSREQLRVWQREVRLLQNEVVIGDEVDIDRPRPPAALLAALASEGALDRLRARQQRARREAGFDRDAEIDERRLVFDPPRGGAIAR